MHRSRRHRIIAAGLGVLFVAVGAGLWFVTPTQLADDIQSGRVKISERGERIIDVYYRRPYTYPPHLNVTFEKELDGRIELVEQRPDGFRFAARNYGYSTLEGAWIRWTAEGVTK